MPYVVKHYGFEFPPVGLIDVLSKVNPPEGSVFYILDPFTGATLPYDEISSSSKEKLFVIINTHEGASHHWFDRLLPQLIDQCGVYPKNIILHSSCLHDPDSPITNIHSIIDDASDLFSRYSHYNIEYTEPTHHYVCLNRVHRWQRLKLIRLLIDRDLCKFGRISYIDMSAISADDPHRSYFPMTIDYTNVSWAQGHEASNSALTHALFNVITESCYERQPGHTIFESHSCPGVTEKTFKSILLGQLPIFVAPQYTVKFYKKLGFDVFDDFVNHDYDSESDPVIRLNLIVDQINHITKIPINQLNTIKRQLMPRFCANWDRLKYYSNNWVAEIPQWQRYFANFKPG
jgi:hypothetical protein